MPVTHHSVSGPHFDLELTPLDHMYCAVYSRRILAFEGLPASIEDTTSVLLKALQATVNAVPYLAGSVLAASDAGRTDNRFSVVPGKAHLLINDLTSTVSFADLKAKGFPSSEFKHEIFIPAPHIAIPFPGMPRDITLIQANFVDEGLFLVFCYHHVIADGLAMTQLTRLFASYCAAISEGEDYSLAPRNAPKLDLNRAATMQFPENVDPDICLKYYTDFSSDSGHPVGSYKPRTDIANVDFRISPASAAKLKAAASSPATPTNTSWISTADAINALFWRAIVRARLSASILQPTDLVDYSNSIDFRAKLASPLSRTWIGNAIVMLPTESIPASEIARSGPASLAAAARAIRASVQSVDAELVGSLLKRASTVPNPFLFRTAALAKLMTTSVISTSQRGFVHADMEWGKRAMGRYVGIFSPAGSPVEGLAYVKPPLEDGGWEVNLSLAERCMDLLREDQEFKTYVKEVGGHVEGEVDGQVSGRIDGQVIGKVDELASGQSATVTVVA